MKQLMQWSRTAGKTLKTTLSSAARYLVPGAALVAVSSARADVSAIETAATAAITQAKGTGEVVLVAAFMILVGFLIFKVGKRAMGKA